MSNVLHIYDGTVLICIISFWEMYYYHTHKYTFSHLADALIQNEIDLWFSVLSHVQKLMIKLALTSSAVNRYHGNTTLIVHRNAHSYVSQPETGQCSRIMQRTHRSVMLLSGWWGTNYAKLRYMTEGFVEWKFDGVTPYNTTFNRTVFQSCVSTIWLNSPESCCHRE